MIAFFGKEVGVNINSKSYFTSIWYNGNRVKEIRVNGTSVAFGTYVPDVIKNLEAQGCAKIVEIYDLYPNILHCIDGTAGLFFTGNSCFDTGYVPEYTDTIEAELTFPSLTTAAKTLWCTRKGSNNSFTTFVINANVRFDYGSTNGSTTWFPSLSAGVHYHFKHSPSTSTLAVNDNTKTLTMAEFTPLSPITVGASYETYSATGNKSNYLNQAYYHIFSVKGNDGQYKRYLIPVADNTFADAVTGEILTNRGTGTVELQTITSISSED